VSTVEQLLARAEPAWVFPPTPPLESAVLGRVARPRARRRWVLAAAVAAVLILAGVAVAATPLLDWLGLRGVEIRWVDRLPPTTTRGELAFGDRVTLAQARDLAPFRILVPTVDDLDRPTAVYHRRAPAGDMVTFVYEADGRQRLVLSQWAAHAMMFSKVVPLGTPVEWLQVGPRHGVWVGGRGHAVRYLAVDGTRPAEPFALAAHTLLWHDDRVAYRLEAGVSRAEAVRIARTLR
jgi:hypothetical protein